MIDFTYYVVGNAGLCFFFFLSLLKFPGKWVNPLLRSDVLFLTVLSAFLIINKLTFYKAGLINIDESIFLSGGRTLGYDFRPWISLDTTTSGPINFLPALLLLKMDDWVSYGELRLFYAAAFQIPVIIIFFYTFRKLSNPHLARLAVIPISLTFGFLFLHDHVHASSENPPMLLLTIVLCILTRIIADDQVKKWELAFSGMLCAASFYTKLQVAPIFYFIAFFTFVVLYFVKLRKQDSLFLIAGFISTNVVIVGYIMLYGGFQDWLQSYIFGNLVYSAGTISPVLVALFFFQTSKSTLFPILLLIPLSGLILWLRSGGRLTWRAIFYHCCFFVTLAVLDFVLDPVKYSRYLLTETYDPTPLLPIALVIIMISLALLMRLAYHIKGKDLIYNCGFLFTVLITFYCILKPGRFFLHYSLLLIVPAFAWISWILFKNSWFSGRYTTVVAGALIALLFIDNTISASKVLNNSWVFPSVVSPDMMAFLEANHAENDRMAVWGWGSNYNHESKMIMGTRDVHFGFQTGFRLPERNYYLSRYLYDLKINKPRWFLDISAPGGMLTTDKSLLIYFPLISDYVEKNYARVYQGKFEVLYRLKNSSDK